MRWSVIGNTENSCGEGSGLDGLTSSLDCKNFGGDSGVVLFDFDIGHYVSCFMVYPIAIY
jgi:hypothetical protein